MSQGPIFAPDAELDGYTAYEAAHRLHVISDLLEVYQVPAEQLDELKAISSRFTRQINTLPLFRDGLIEFAQQWCQTP